ncbi:hypothetical protein imdm_28 [gamma proteobacterium IMCC2047]|nr:hypothetical protein imdm_28 [gamma proteobacterium IMCC2047]
MNKKIHLTIVLEMPEETEKKNSLFRFFAVDNSFQGGKIIAAMIGDAIADLEQLKKTPTE